MAIVECPALEKSTSLTIHQERGKRKEEVFLVFLPFFFFNFFLEENKKLML